jgi:hypothetical protein
VVYTDVALSEVCQRSLGLGRDGRAPGLMERALKDSALTPLPRRMTWMI